MKKTSVHLPRLAGRLLAVPALIALSALSLQATDVAYVTTFIGASLTVCDPYCNDPLGTGCTISTSGSTAISAAPGIPSRTRCTYGLAGAVNWSIKPATIVDGATYRIEVAHTAVASCTPDVLVTAFSADGTVSPSCTNTIEFQRARGGDLWREIGYITNNPGVTSPTIIFYYVSGTLNNTGTGRFYIDGFKFTEINPCDGVVGDVAITGPLVANQTFVNVTAVTAGATNVTVYLNGSEIGQTNFGAGFAAGALTVPTTALSKDGEVKATQTKNGCTSAMPVSGPLVGGGANPQVKVSLGCGLLASLTGPAGADTSGAATAYYWVKATGLTGGSGTAPVGGPVLSPGNCWQTVTFDFATDPMLFWLNGSAYAAETNAFCVLDSLVFALDTDVSDTGPYDIYVDRIMNGDLIIEDFEGWNAGTGVTFAAPNASATYPPPVSTYLASPNSGLVSQVNAYSGTNSCRIRWQFQNTLSIHWARILASRANGATYPQLDSSKPVTVRYLVLPVGTTIGSTFNGTVSAITNASPAYTTGTNTLGVTVTGAGSYTYSWTWSGGALPNPTTNPTYTIGDTSASGLSSADNGTYTVTVTAGTCSESRSVQVTVVDPLPTITNQPVAKTIAHVGDNVTFSVGGSAPVAGGFPLTYQWRFNGADIADASASSYTTNNVQVANAGYYTVVVSNTYGGATSSVATLDVVQPAVVIGSGTGLRGNYYNPAYSTNPFAGPIVLSRIDPTVDFIWGQGVTGYPAPSITADFFTVRWLGQVRALDTDTYTFYVKSDDGQRLWVNGQQLVNDWILHGATEVSGTIALTANQQYAIVMEYFENAVAASAQLSWSAAAGGVVKEIIPQSQLYPASTTVTSPPLSFSLNDGTNLVFNWGPGTYTLAWATNVTGPYTNRINGVISPYTNIIGSEPQKYFRLQVLQ